MTNNELESFRSDAHLVLCDYYAILTQVKSMPPVLEKEGVDRLFDDLQNMERLLAEFENLVQVPEIDDETFIRAKEQISKIERAMRILRKLYT